MLVAYTPTLNVHLHCLVLDGVYRRDADGVPAFVEVDAPTDDELHTLLQTLITRLMKRLTRQGVLVEQMGLTHLAGSDADGGEARTLRPLQAAAITFRIDFGPRAGHKVLTLRGAMPARGCTAAAPVRRHRRLQSARRSACGGTRPQAARAAMALHHPPGSI